MLACATNDVFYYEIKRAGLSAFREGTDGAWKAVEAGILTKSNTELSKLRDGMEDLVWRSAD